MVNKIVADVTESVRSDFDGFAALSKRLSQAAVSAESCRADSRSQMWTDEEIYRLVRLAYVGSAILAGRIIGMEIG